MHALKFYLIMVLTILLTLSACNGEKTDEPDDPCDSIKKTTYARCFRRIDFFGDHPNDCPHFFFIEFFKYRETKVPKRFAEGVIKVADGHAPGLLYGGFTPRHRDIGQLGGPYKLVRHPGYVGTILFELSSPFLLGSLWAFIPGGLAALVFIIRTAYEDRSLQDELDGYTDFAAQVRYRLLPGIW